MKPRYRELLDPGLALARLLARLGPPGSLPAERIKVEAAAGRLTSARVRARHSSPAYHAAAMDGIAVAAAATAGASATSPQRLLSGREAFPIDTGDPLPAGCDAVIPIENLQAVADGFEITAAAYPRQHVRLTGEDLSGGEILLASGRLLTPARMGVLLAAGVTEIEVRCRPGVGILPTGDELCQPGEDPRPGKVVESNSRMIAAMVADWGGAPQRLSPVVDREDLLEDAVRDAARRFDVVLTLAGSSAGRGDFMPAIIARCGELLFHGLALMPGKPAFAGLVDGTPVIGLPGFPVSAVVVAERLVRPVLAHLAGAALPERERLSATLLRSIPSRAGLEEIIRVLVGKIGARWVAVPLGRGAGALTTLARAQGLVRISAADEGLQAGAPVEVELLCSRREVEESVLFAGSHDLALSLLDDFIGRKAPGCSLAVLPVGSQAGLLALARSEAHLAGSHLLDSDGRDYNREAIARLLPGRPVERITLALRKQGLCLRRDDPRRPTSIGDAVRAGMRFVNRQAGSGTRVLFDHVLRREGIGPEKILGYDHEEFTHLAVAEAVRSGIADCGLVIGAAAEAEDLDFVPVADERYDLVIPQEHLSDRRIRLILEILADKDFCREVESLGGYSTRETGTIRR
ncbi:MAG: molybdopterin biosynthesis protein [Myxococcales bacterium]|nr:molybdopterin biosynthesis protein [Myxococcales bacterium]